MVTAALSGVVDFRAADPLDRRWWLRLRLALDHIEALNLARQHRLYFDYDLAILSRDDLTEASSKQFTADAEKKLFALVNLWRPWDKHDPAQSQAAQVDELGKAWAREFGDQNSPEVQRAIAETVRLLERLDVGARKKNVPTAVG